MGHLLHTIAITLCFGTGLSCQPLPACLQVEHAEPHLARLLAACTTSLRAAAPLATANGMDLAFTVLGQLRLGDTTAACDTLEAWSNARGANIDAAAPELAWFVVAHYWYLRASRDAGPIRSHWPVLQNAMRPAAAAAPRATFVQEAMLVHGMFCMGGLLDTRDRIEAPSRWLVPPSPRPGASWTRKAIERQWELEGSAWQPGRGHFRPHPTAGAIVLPERADVSVLVPAAAGMLVATGDRLLRHLRTVIGEGQATTSRASATTTPFLPFADAIELSAATQVEDDAARARCWSAMLGALDPEGLPSPHAGARLDAACFALTGVRLATGAGVDEDVVRVRPWLPPDHDHLLLRGLRVDGVHLDLELSLRTGPLCRDEAGEPALNDVAAPAPRLRVRLALVATPSGMPRTVIVQGAGMQYLAELQPGEILERSLPRSCREPQHEPRAR